MTIDKNKLTSDLQEQLQDTQSSFQSIGLGGDNIAELNPKFNYWPSEIVYSGKHDAHIVLGRDRAGIFNNAGGYGSLGHTSCASIDIVVGRKSSAENFDIKNDYANPDFITDAARIYISQKADIDTYFGLPSTKYTDSVSRSAVSAKADAIRLVARENIKLVVGTDQKNSQGDIISITGGGIDLIGGGQAQLQKANELVYWKDNKEAQTTEIKKQGMQPIPLGINTNFALEQLATKLDKLCGAVSTLGGFVLRFLQETTYHEHTNLVSSYFGQPTFPSTDYIKFSNVLQSNILQYTIKDVDNLREEIYNYKAQHLNPAGPYYINSKYHSLN